MTPPPESSPTAIEPVLPAGETPQPVTLAQSWAQPWQYLSATLTSGGPVLYRLRYPPGWHVYIQPGGSATLQNFPSAQASPDRLEPGMIRVEISATQAEKTGGLPAPNTRTLAAGRPGTRQILLDSSLGITIWNVRLYGIVDNSVAFNLVGWLNLGAQEKDEGIRLLDTMLGTLEIYSWTDSAPTPVPLDGSNSDTWSVYSGQLQTSAGKQTLSFRYPRNWWLDQDGSRRVDLTNYVIVGASGSEPLPAGGVRLSINAATCTEAGGCPARPPYLFTGLPGTREVAQVPGGETSWLVRIFQADTQIILYASMNGSPHQVAEQIQALDMILRTVQLR